MPEAIKTENGRKAALSTNCFRVLCELLKSAPYTSQVLEPVACSLEILSRGGYDPCSVVLKPNAWNDASHVQPFIDSFALTGKAYSDNRERKRGRLRRHCGGAPSEALGWIMFKEGQVRQGFSHYSRGSASGRCVPSLALLAEGGVDAFTCTASTALRILLLGAASIPKPLVLGSCSIAALSKRRSFLYVSISHQKNKWIDVTRTAAGAKGDVGTGLEAHEGYL